MLGDLRDEAIRHGLDGKVDGTSVYEFTQNLVSIAHEGISSSNQRYFSYIDYCLKVKKNGADRALDFVRNEKGSLEKKLIRLVLSRTSLL